MIADLIDDVGLHKGDDAAFDLKKGLKVLGIEANPELVQHCRSRFRNEVANGQLRIIEGAIAPASESPTIAFYVNSDSVLSTISRNRAERTGTIHMPVCRGPLPTVSGSPAPPGDVRRI